MLDRIVRAGITIAVVSVLLQTAAHTLSETLSDSPLPYLSVNAERNPITWLHGVAIFASAFVCALAAVATHRRRLAFSGLAVILSFMSLDEMIMIHERIATRVLIGLNLTEEWDSVIWPVIYTPIAGVLVLLLAAVARDAPVPARRLIAIGVGFLIASVAAEVLSAPWSTGSNLIHSIEGAFEEGAELVGWMTIATGLTAIVLLTVMPGAAPDDMEGRDASLPR